MSADGPVGRAEIISALRAALEPLPQVLAMWEGGSAAFGRADAWSDIDLYVLAEDESVEAALEAADQALARLGPVAARWRLPEPTWHGHAQVFCRPAAAPEHLVVDLVVLRRSVPERFLDEERHGVPVVYFDRTEEIVPRPLDRAAFAGEAAQRLEVLRPQFALFQGFVRAEVARGDAMAALQAYRAYTLRPLLDAVRMRHCPERYDYGPKYSRRDLPPEVTARLERLFYVPDLTGIPERQAEAEAWFAESVAALERDGIPL
ncbi:MAG: nucleotidyltransferase domain-containing protein [Acidimicrobiia bacterium]|nr:nucleotidyltransferase domain-containing protein [Acidimicrobiia bacterium]